MTRRQLFALPIVAAVPALASSLPTDPYATVYIGKFDRGYGNFVRRKFRVPGPWIDRSPTTAQIAIVDVTLDVRESVHLPSLRNELTPVLSAIGNYYHQRDVWTLA